jgi:hypothetical protein
VPVTIHKKVKEPVPVVPVAVQAHSIPVRPVFTQTIHVGNSSILPDMDLHDIPGRTKFLVHLNKTENGTAIWYRVVGYDEDTGQMKLRSRHKNTFDTKMHPSVSLYYMVVVESEGVDAPSSDAFHEIRKLVIDPLPPDTGEKKTAKSKK